MKTPIWEAINIPVIIADEYGSTSSVLTAFHRRIIPVKSTSKMDIRPTNWDVFSVSVLNGCVSACSTRKPRLMMNAHANCAVVLQRGNHMAVADEAAVPRFDEDNDRGQQEPMEQDNFLPKPCMALVLNVNKAIPIFDSLVHKHVATHLQQRQLRRSSSSSTTTNSNNNHHQ